VNDFIEKILERLATVDTFDPREFSGCSEMEISTLEQAHPQMIALPSTYKEFLSFSGKGLVYMQPSSTFYYSGILAFTSNEIHNFFNKVPFSRAAIFVEIKASRQAG